VEAQLSKPLVFESCSKEAVESKIQEHEVSNFRKFLFLSDAVSLFPNGKKKLHFKNNSCEIYLMS